MPALSSAPIRVSRGPILPRIARMHADKRGWHFLLHSTRSWLRGWIWVAGKARARPSVPLCGYSRKAAEFRTLECVVVTDRERGRADRLGSI
jgi:hypothetical protein